MLAPLSGGGFVGDARVRFCAAAVCDTVCVRCCKLVSVIGLLVDRAGWPCCWFCLLLLRNYTPLE